MRRCRPESDHFLKSYCKKTGKKKCQVWHYLCVRNSEVVHFSNVNLGAGLKSGFAIRIQLTEKKFLQKNGKKKCQLWH